MPLSPWRQTGVGGKHGQEGFVSLQALLPRAEHLVTFVPSGAQGGPEVSFFLGREVFFFLSDSQKGSEASHPFGARESVFS